MFAKLLKHEWRASAGTLGILSAAALSLGVLGVVALRVLVRTDTMLQENPALVFLPVMLGFALVFMALGLVVYVVGCEFMLLYRFYKSRYTDEGYLTFTLPVNSHQNFLAAYLNILLGTILVGVVASVSVSIAVLFGTAETGLVNTQALREMGSVLNIYQGIYSEVYGLEGNMFWLTALSFVTNILYTPMMIMTCITVGSVAAKKHKLLAAIGCYYAASFAVSTLTTLITSLVFAGAVNNPEAMTQTIFTGTYLLQTGIQLGLGVGCYFLNIWLMDHKLNLT